MRIMTIHPTDQLESYALGALSPDEMLTVAGHVERCPVCQERLHELDGTLGLLAALAPDMSPPDGAEDRLFARIAQLRADTSRRAAPSEQMSAPEAAVPQVTATPVRPIGTISSRSRQVSYARMRRAVYGLVAVAASLLIVVGILSARLSTAQTVNAELTQRNAQQQQALGIMVSPGAVVRHLVATEPTAGGATGTMAMDPASKNGVFVVSRLPQLPPGKIYEFWLVRSHAGTSEGEAIPTGTFGVDGTGAAVYAFSSTFAADQLGNAGVSVEPAGGATHPDSPMIMLIAS